MAKIRRLADEFQNAPLQPSHDECIISDVNARIDPLPKDLEVRVDRISREIETSIKSAVGESFGTICTVISKINQRLDVLEHRSDLLDRKSSENVNKIHDIFKAIEQRMDAIGKTNHRLDDLEHQSDFFGRELDENINKIHGVFKAVERHMDAIERKSYERKLGVTDSPRKCARVSELLRNIWENSRRIKDTL